MVRWLAGAGLMALALTAAAAAPPEFVMPASERENLAANPSWTAAQPPFRIHGNTWHVGPRGLGVFLIAARSGHVLIDAGVPGGAGQIEANIRRAGFRLRDIKWILNTQAHFDHAGDMARLARDTGAQVIDNAADAPLLERGGSPDPAFGEQFPFPPVRVGRTVRDGEVLKLGTLTITAHATPGHTPGNTSWTWESCEDGRCLRMADIGSLSSPGYDLVEHVPYPGIVDDFERSFGVVAALPCDIAIAPHPEMVDFWERVEARAKGERWALVDSTLARGYAEAAREAFAKKLAEQRAAKR
jgi:metallo-beta-lactamase class B